MLFKKESLFTVPADIWESRSTPNKWGPRLTLNIVKSSFTIHVTQIVMPYSLNLCSAVGQLISIKLEKMTKCYWVAERMPRKCGGEQY